METDEKENRKRFIGFTDRKLYLIYINKIY